MIYLDVYILDFCVCTNLLQTDPIMATVISMLHSEIIDIPNSSSKLKQPAFIHSQTLPGTPVPTQKDAAELHSINYVTVSNFEGR